MLVARSTWRVEGAHDNELLTGKRSEWQIAVSSDDVDGTRAS